MFCLSTHPELLHLQNWTAQFVLNVSLFNIIKIFFPQQTNPGNISKIQKFSHSLLQGIAAVAVMHLGSSAAAGVL